MKSIRVKFLGPTDTKGSRYVASDGDGNKITVPYNYDLDSGANCEAAAQALCDKMGWKHPSQRGWFKQCCYFTFPDGGINK